MATQPLTLDNVHTKLQNTENAGQLPLLQPHWVHEILLEQVPKIQNMYTQNETNMFIDYLYFLFTSGKTFRII